MMMKLLDFTKGHTLKNQHKHTATKVNKMALTDKERKARSRAKMRDGGYQEILVKVHADDVGRVRNYTSKLRQAREKAKIQLYPY